MKDSAQSCEEGKGGVGGNNTLENTTMAVNEWLLWLWEKLRTASLQRITLADIASEDHGAGDARRRRRSSRRQSIVGFHWLDTGRRHRDVLSPAVIDPQLRRRPVMSYTCV